ncbi:MAG: DUF4386 domain-containing protein [Gemmatimonadota bacterium]|nr:DUF4386 domain-containing protein [Gemmatimonadota bacterium]MDZ4863839.1 DUF4386 domain-containing protein [Gemmatimonadota bacterium]
MTRTTNARIAGVTYLFYIAVGLTSMVLSGRASGGAGIAEKLASIGQHTTAMGVVTLSGLLQSVAALVLAVTTYALTREEDPDLAMLGLTCRVGEGLIGIGIPTSLGLVWLATATGADAPDTAAAHALGAFLREVGGWTSLTSATFFAVGSTLFSFLFLRGRLIPISLAWLGVIASGLLVACLPLRLAGFLDGPVTLFMWLPMLVYEVTLAIWLLIKGVAAPAPR